MGEMFAEASLFNQNLNNWDVYKVMNMRYTPVEVVEKERNALSDAVSQKGRIEENIASLM